MTTIAESRLSAAKRAEAVVRAVSGAASSEDTSAMTVSDRLAHVARVAELKQDVRDRQADVRAAEQGLELARYEQAREDLTSRLMNAVAPGWGAVPVSAGEVPPKAQFPESSLTDPRDRSTAKDNGESLITFTLDRAGVKPPAGSPYEIAR